MYERAVIGRFDVEVGGAVERNRAKRRLRAAASAILPLYARERHDYVLVARTATLTRSFTALEEDLLTAIAAAHAGLDRRKDQPEGRRNGKTRRIAGANKETGHG